MLKKTISYPDLDGNTVTEDFYFNLSMAEVAEMELSQKGGLVGYLETIVAKEDGEAIIRTFKQIIMKSVGRRSEDGKRFVKNQEIIDEFMQSEAYSQLFMEMVTDGSKAAAFVEGIVPSNMKEKLANGLPQPKDDEKPAWITENREPTDEELRTMNADQMREVFRRRQVKDNT
ncbi:MAG: hypothetical protein LC687_01725 [Actinobacteria bacterium]|nr:hypothetical protein [Actinomycetota bacterium]